MARPAPPPTTVSPVPMMVAPMATLTARPPFDAMKREKALPSSSAVSTFALIWKNPL